MPPLPADIALVELEVVTLGPPGNGYKIQFLHGVSDPRPEIYFTEPGKQPSATLHRRVRWTWTGTLPPEHYLRIVPKAYNSQIFHGPAPKGTTNEEKKELEKHRLDNTIREVTSNTPLRGPKLNLGLAWYYCVIMYKEGEPSSIAKFPPSVVDAAEGQEIAYLDPVVVIKDE